MRIAIIGAGLSAASCAHALCGPGRQIDVYEQAACVGGRLHTQRAHGWEFDCGAQYFTARDPHFLAHLGAWQHAGLVAPWQARIVAFDADGSRSAPTPLVRWIALPGMDTLAAALLHSQFGVQVHLNTEVARVEYGEHWKLFDPQGQLCGESDWLLICMPPAQALRLCSSVTAAVEYCAQVSMSPSWTLLLGFAQPLTLDFDGAFVNGRALSWLCRNNSKPGRSAQEAWVLQAGAPWSASRSAAEQAYVRDKLLGDFSELVGSVATPQFVAVKRWDYALGSSPNLQGCFISEPDNLAIAGDWCHAGRVEGAFLSGLTLAKRLLAAWDA